ncbi:hypothetical protein C9975_11360 [Thalassospira xiamenensis]|nr:hypothetical protein C9975_11360 [Thalassospira xiamenensis]
MAAKGNGTDQETRGVSSPYQVTAYRKTVPTYRGGFFVLTCLTAWSFCLMNKTLDRFNCGHDPKGNNQEE